MPTAQRVRNWRDYKTSLRRRGEIIFSFEGNYIREIYYDGPQARAGAR